MSPAMIYRCKPGITWVKDLDRVVVVDSSSNRGWRMEGQEMEIWELLNLGYTFPKIVALLSVVYSQSEADTSQSVERILAGWVEAGMVLEGQNG
jgi:hypothetical protein